MTWKRPQLCAVGPWILVLLMLPLSRIYAEELKPTDFAYGVAVQTDGAYSLYRIQVPKQAYKWSQRAGLADLRVFDSNGQMVPHMVRTVVPKESEVTTTTELPMFPIYCEAGTPEENLNVHISTGDAGTILNVQSTSDKPLTDSVGYYIVDASAINESIRQLQLQWDYEGDNLVGTVHVQTSEDLETWRHLGSGTITELRYESKLLVRRLLTLNKKNQRYLRLSWPASVQQARLTNVSVITSTVTTQEGSLWLYPRSVDAGDASKDWTYYDVDGHYPVGKANMDFSSGTGLADVAIESRSNGTWRERYRGPLYRLNVQGAVVESGPASFPVVYDRHWRVRAIGNGSAFGSSPQLQLAWKPQELIFVAQGDTAGYTIAFGSGIAEPPGNAVQGLLVEFDRRDEENMVGTVQGGREIKLGGPDALIEPQDTGTTRKIVLWLSLLAGVALLAWMVLRLAREMRDARDV